MCIYLHLWRSTVFWYFGIFGIGARVCFLRQLLVCCCVSWRSKHFDKVRMVIAVKISRDGIPLEEEYHHLALALAFALALANGTRCELRKTIHSRNSHIKKERKKINGLSSISKGALEQSKREQSFHSGKHTPEYSSTYL